MSSEDKHTVIASPEFLKRIVLAYEPILPNDSWYSIAGVVFSALNLPEDVARVGEFVTTEHNNNGGERSLPQKKDEGASLRIRKMKEALLKSMVVVGLPKVGTACISQQLALILTMHAIRQSIQFLLFMRFLKARCCLAEIPGPHGLGTLTNSLFKH
jgi:hypothetical protein